MTTEEITESADAEGLAADHSDESEEPSIRRLAWQTFWVTVILVAMVAGAGWLLRDPLTELARWLVENLGLAGMFVGVFLADTFTFPIPPDIYIFIAVASGVDVVPALTTVAIASVIAGNVAYHIGPYISEIPLLRKRIEKFRPRGEKLFAKYGVWAVAIAAMTPVPFSVVCWMAGTYRMKYSSFAMATLMRIPRVIGYYWLYKMGWAPAV
jgi:membrane protein YqaA with SNARE-associated domain